MVLCIKKINIIRSNMFPAMRESREERYLPATNANMA
jgi:hypothetical protein